MKPFTITIQPCACPVTLTIHADDVTVNPPSAITSSVSAGSNPAIPDRYIHRVVNTLERSGGYLQAVDFHRYLQQPSELYNAVIEASIMKRFCVDKNQCRRPAVFYVLPGSVDIFKAFVESRGWKIVEPRFWKIAE